MGISELTQLACPPRHQWELPCRPVPLQTASKRRNLECVIHLVPKCQHQSTHLGNLLDIDHILGFICARIDDLGTPGNLHCHLSVRSRISSSNAVHQTQADIKGLAASLCICSSSLRRRLAAAGVVLKYNIANTALLAPMQLKNKVETHNHYLQWLLFLHGLLV